MVSQGLPDALQWALKARAVSAPPSSEGSHHALPPVVSIHVTSTCPEQGAEPRPTQPRCGGITMDSIHTQAPTQQGLTTASERLAMAL